MPDLPDPPLRVLAHAAHSLIPKRRWFTLLPGGTWKGPLGANDVYYSKELIVVPDPRNDPAAVRMIEEAKRA